MAGHPMASAEHDPASLLRERDLYRRLLDLGHTEALESFLREALALIVEATAASHGYLELEDDEEGGQPRWWIAHGLDGAEVEAVRDLISRGIVAEALATGQTIATVSARLDPRFGERASVQARGIEAVLCAPIGADLPRGAIYLQRSPGAGFFSEDNRACAEIFARHLAPLVDGVLARQREKRTGDPTLPARARARLDGVIGRSAALASVLDQVALVAPLDVSVLFTGESGTGKSQLARALHDNSPRANRTFVDLNCAALPDTLIESELFGALPGAHSTATRRVEGKVAAADGGTLLLDEVGDLSLTAQGKLLQLLQSKEYYPLGGTKPVHANVRVLAATNVDLAQSVAERRFREDLFYRLKVVPIRVPSLAERKVDIALLASHFCRAACDRYGFPRLELSVNALRAAEAAEWPGNVRQLEHAVEAAVIRAAGSRAPQIERPHLFPEVEAVPGDPEALTFQEATRRFHAKFVRQALEANGWNVVETARRLDMARSHLYTLIRAFGLERT